MAFDPTVHHRRSIRLSGFDYSQSGSYFVTLVVQGRACIFGDISNNKINHSLIGQCVDANLQLLPNHFPIVLNRWVVMPNHIHVLLSIDNKNKSSNPDSFIEETRQPSGTQPQSLGAIIQNFKSVSTRRIHAIQGNIQDSIWQRNYYEHVVRDQNDFDRIEDYIKKNPADWDSDDLKISFS